MWNWFPNLNFFLFIQNIKWGDVTCRFLRHVPVVYVDYPGETSLKQIYGTFNRAMLRMIPNLRAYADPLTNAMVEFYLLSQVCYFSSLYTSPVPVQVASVGKGRIRNKVTLGPELLTISLRNQ